MRISDWSSDVCSSDLAIILFGFQGPTAARMGKPELVDLFRLMRATKSLADQSDYLEYAALTFDLGLPSETKTVQSEEHTSELQSLMRISYAVFCLKKKKNKQYSKAIRHSTAKHIDCTHSKK